MLYKLKYIKYELFYYYELYRIVDNVSISILGPLSIVPYAYLILHYILVFCCHILCCALSMLVAYL